MPSCRHCGHDVGYEATFCPNCGEKNPSEGWVQRDSSSSGDTETLLDLLPWSANQITFVTGAIGAIAGLILGGSFGFDLGGVGGAIIFGVVAGGVGLAVGAAAPILAAVALQGALVVGVIALLIWIIMSLWGVGK